MKNPTATILLAMSLSLGAASASADLQPWKDYEFGDTVMSITTVKVDANMYDKYLEGLKQTWVAANDVAKELGQIKDYRILVSDLPESGDFNLLLIVTYDSLADIQPSKERFEAFMKRWGAENDKRNKEISETYPDVRTISGEYLMRDLTFTGE